VDFSWVRPGKVAWDWWNDFDNKGVENGCTTAGYKRFIDFAAKTGVEYVIMDEGWSEDLNIWKFNPKVDVPEVIRYGKEKGVDIILWMAWAQIVGDEEKVASHFAKLGAKGFKVDFMDRGDALVERFLWDFAEACAKNRLVVDYHGAHRPTGMSRAYPNVLNYEGIHGLECMKWFKPGRYDMMANDVRACYLRMSAGPLDYTPGAMDNYVIGQYKGNNTNPGSEGTRCHQMAMMVVYEAPLQMLSDSPTKYERNMECFSFMAKVPTTWADTLGLGGTPDTFFAVARQAHDGAWYAAAIGGASAQDVTVDTKFLGAGEWKAKVFRDAADSDTAPTHYVHETKTVKAGDALTFRLAPGGGFAVKMSKAVRGGKE
jgi:alpha-glucosidase